MFNLRLPSKTRVFTLRLRSNDGIRLNTSQYIYIYFHSLNSESDLTSGFRYILQSSGKRRYKGEFQQTLSQNFMDKGFIYE
jgi:hypothetical protein